MQTHHLLNSSDTRESESLTGLHANHYNHLVSVVGLEKTGSSIGEKNMKTDEKDNNTNEKLGNMDEKKQKGNCNVYILLSLIVRSALKLSIKN